MAWVSPRKHMMAKRLMGIKPKWQDKILDTWVHNRLYLVIIWTGLTNQSSASSPPCCWKGTSTGVEVCQPWSLNISPILWPTSIYLQWKILYFLSNQKKKKVTMIKAMCSSSPYLPKVDALFASLLFLVSLTLSLPSVAEFEINQEFQFLLFVLTIF